MSEGMYKGITGNTKQLYSKLHNKKIGMVFGTLGKFLNDEYGHDERLLEDMHRTFNAQGHSGGSALVTIQQLFDILGARTLTKEEIEYIKQGI